MLIYVRQIYNVFCIQCIVSLHNNQIAHTMHSHLMLQAEEQTSGLQAIL